MKPANQPEVTTVYEFYTRSQALAPLRALVVQHADLSYSQADLARLFTQVDAYCAETLRTRPRSSPFSPMLLGGAEANHTPPHIIFAVYAIYFDLRAGCPEVVPFRSTPLAMNRATALRIEPEAGFTVKAGSGELAPLTDVLLLLPSSIDAARSVDTYGIPGIREGVISVGCHGAAGSVPEAMFSALLYVHPASRTVLNPWSPLFTEAEQRTFFTEPVVPARLAGFRELNAASMGMPMAMVEHNHITARRVLEACLAEQA